MILAHPGPENNAYWNDINEEEVDEFELLDDDEWDEEWDGLH